VPGVGALRLESSGSLLTREGDPRSGRNRTRLSVQKAVAISVAALTMLTVAGSTAVAAAPPTFQELEESLTCQCGCGLTVASCNHLQCPSAIPLRQEIRTQMAQGLSKEAILAYFANKYGEKILSSPTTVGFNLTAWIMPFLALAAGGALVGVTLVRWRRARRQVPAEGAPPKPADQAGPSPYENILERELKNFDV
jgi:cytochrome c-type biogenesis protein CcmH